MAELSRRQMLQMTGMIGAAAGAGALFAGCAQQSDTAADGNQDATEQFTGLTVYDPSGPYEITQMFADRLDKIDGKTIAFISNDDWEVERTFPIIREYLENNFQNVTILDYTEFTHGYNEIADETTSNLGPDCLAKGVDAAIVGNAG